MALTKRQEEFRTRRLELAPKAFGPPSEEQKAALEELRELCFAEMDEECEHGRTAWSHCGVCDGPIENDS